jgi:hypothetical protein
MGQKPPGPNFITRIFGTGSQPSYNYLKNSKLSLFSGDLWLPQATHTHARPSIRLLLLYRLHTHTHIIK